MSAYNHLTGRKPGDADQCVSGKTIAGLVPGNKPEVIPLSCSSSLDPHCPPVYSGKRPKCSELHNVVEAVKYGILKPLIFGCLVYDKNPLLDRNSQIEKETLVMEVFRKAWNHHKLPLDKLQLIYSFQLNEGNQFHFHFVICKKGIPSSLTRDLCDYFFGNHNGHGTAKVERYKFNRFENRGLFYLTKKLVMNDDVPVSFTREVKKALNKLKIIRIRHENMLGHLFDRIENKKSLVAVSTYRRPKPSSLVLIPQIHSHLHKYFQTVSNTHNLAVVQVKGGCFYFTCYKQVPVPSYQDWDQVDCEQLRALRIQLSRRRDEPVSNLYLSPELDRVLREGIEYENKILFSK